MAQVVAGVVEAAAGRCVWGTDWPHTNMFGPLLPDDGKLLGLLYDWAPDSQRLHHILVDNPAELCGFCASEVVHVSDQESCS